MNKCYGSDWTLLLMARQAATLSVVGILAQTQESFCHTGFITEQVPLGWTTYYCQWISRLPRWQITRTTYWQCDWPWKAQWLYPMSACMTEWRSNCLTPAGRMDPGWRSSRGPQGGCGDKDLAWEGKVPGLGKCLVSSSPPPKKDRWIWVWRRLARELRGCPWGLRGCFPKTASDAHCEQLTTAISCLLPPFLVSGEYLRLSHSI